MRNTRCILACLLATLSYLHFPHALQAPTCTPCRYLVDRGSLLLIQTTADGCNQELSRQQCYALLVRFGHHDASTLVIGASRRAQLEPVCSHSGTCTRSASRVKVKRTACVHCCTASIRIRVAPAALKSCVQASVGVPLDTYQVYSQLARQGWLVKRYPCHCQRDHGPAAGLHVNWARHWADSRRVQELALREVVQQPLAGHHEQRCPSAWRQESHKVPPGACCAPLPLGESYSEMGLLERHHTSQHADSLLSCAALRNLHTGAGPAGHRASPMRTRLQPLEESGGPWQAQDFADSCIRFALFAPGNSKAAAIRQADPACLIAVPASSQQSLAAGASTDVPVTSLRIQASPSIPVCLAYVFSGDVVLVARCGAADSVSDQLM
jgi:hypothetical protein